jgi:hypothetical protein
MRASRYYHSLVTVESVENEEDCCWDGGTHREIRLELDLPRCQDVGVVAGEIAELVLPILLGGDEKVPGEEGGPGD